MAEILGLGITHQPTLLAKISKPSSLLRTLQDPGMPADLRTPDSWPAAMCREWANDSGATHGQQHRDAIVEELRKVRQTLDAFRPDVMVIWGDDQFENFHDDLVPAFCVLAYGDMSFSPWSIRDVQNYWDEPKEQMFTFHGHRQAAKYLTTNLLGSSFDVAYAYRPLHAILGHAFGNSLLYLDWDRRGIDYPVIPISVNCYGRRLVAQKGYLASLETPLTEDQFDPPSPSPARCFALGAACARIFSDSPWRVALIASSSWSHAFLTEKNYYLYPDHASDQELYRAMLQGKYDIWEARSLTQVEDSGQQELLNWFCLIGAMSELKRCPESAVYFESSVMNSNKVIAKFPPL